MSLEKADEVVRGLWKKDVKVWEANWVPIFRKFAYQLILDSEISQGQILLDIGTGTGVAAFEAARRTKPDGFVFGIDRLRPMILLAEAKAARAEFRNVRFIQMDETRLFFPNNVFDVATSNCGISYIGFRQTATEVFRVLREGGTFVYNDWRLKDVPPHNVFSQILEQYRTNKPSRILMMQRTALATLERFGNREVSMKAQLLELRKLGFRRIVVKQRNYSVTLPSLEAYLAMRLKRAPLKQELKELPPAGRRRLFHALRDGLRPFVRGKRFIIHWKLTFVRSEKASA